MKRIKSVIFSLWRTLKLFPLRLVEVVGIFFPENSIGCKIRGFLYKPFLRKCGKNFQVGIGVKMEFLENIEVGDNVYIGYRSWVSGLNGGVKFKDEVMTGPSVKIISSNHTFRNGSARFAKSVGGKIEIGRGTWIASGVIITAGCKIGDSCLIAAGSVVTKSFSNNNIIAGVPAKIINKQND